jgi:hypothetical protein
MDLNAKPVTLPVLHAVEWVLEAVFLVQLAISCLQEVVFNLTAAPENT